MSDTPKFEVIDRRRMKAEQEQAQQGSEPTETPVESAAAPEPATGLGPRLVVPEETAAPVEEPVAELDEELNGDPSLPPMPPPPSEEEAARVAATYTDAAARVEELIRAQNPAMGAPPPVGFEHLVQQLYLSAMIQMGAGAQEGQRPRIDIVGAKNTIDLLAVLEARTQGALNKREASMLATVLVEVRATFIELVSMISLQGMTPPPMPPNMR